MDAITVLEQLFDDVWSHRRESLETLLADLTDDEASWQPSAYREEPAEENWPPPGSILWHVAHVTHVNRYLALVLELRAQSEMPTANARVPLQGVSSEVEALHTVHKALRATIRAIPVDDLSAGLPNGESVARFIGLGLRHTTWHAGQIAQTRRLYAKRAEQTPEEPAPEHDAVKVPLS